MLRAFSIATIAAFIVWSLQAFSGLEKTIIELLVVGRIPSTEIYMNFVSTLPVLVVLLFLLMRITRQIMIDFIDFSVDYHKMQQQTLAQKEVAAALYTPEYIIEPTLSVDEELDLLSI